MTGETVKRPAVVDRAFLSKVGRISVAAGAVFSVLCPLFYFRGEFSWDASVLTQILAWSGLGAVYGFACSLAVIGTVVWLFCLGKLIVSGLPLLVAPGDWAQWFREAKPLQLIAKGFAGLLLWVPMLLVAVAATLVTGAA